MAFKPNTNTEKVQKYRSIIANSATITVGDVIISGTTAGTSAASPYVVGAGATTSATTGILGVVVSIFQENGESALNTVTVSSSNETSASPFVAEWISAADKTVDWVADVNSSGTYPTSADEVNTYILYTLSNGTINGAATYNTGSVFTGYKNIIDSNGHYSKVIGRFNNAASL